MCSICGLATRAVMTTRVQMKAVRKARPASRTALDGGASTSLFFALATIDPLGKFPIHQCLLQKYIISLYGNKASPAVSHGKLPSRATYMWDFLGGGSPGYPISQAIKSLGRDPAPPRRIDDLIVEVNGLAVFAI